MQKPWKTTWTVEDFSLVILRVPAPLGGEGWSLRWPVSGFSPHFNFSWVQRIAGEKTWEAYCRKQWGCPLGSGDILIPTLVESFPFSLKVSVQHGPMEAASAVMRAVHPDPDSSHREDGTYAAPGPRQTPATKRGVARVLGGAGGAIPLPMGKDIGKWVVERDPLNMQLKKHENILYSSCIRPLEWSSPTTSHKGEKCLLEA